MYDYNVSEAKEYLAKAGFPNGQGLPPITFTVLSGSSASAFQSDIAQIVQQNLAQIGITVNIEEQVLSILNGRFGSYQYNLQNAQNVPMMSLWEPVAYAPDFVAPSDYWVAFVCNCSIWGNQAIYSNPIVDQGVALMSQTNDETKIVEGLTSAQKQIYDDAPYVWLGETHLLLIDASYVWNKAVITHVLSFDPNLEGVCDIPPFNTYVFAGTDLDTALASTTPFPFLFEFLP